MCIKCHTFIAFISINITIFFGAIILVLLLVFVNIRLNNCIFIHLRQFLVNLNIFVILFAKKRNRNIFIFVIAKKVNPNVFVFVFAKQI